MSARTAEERALEAIIQELPSNHLRAAALTHLYRLREAWKVDPPVADPPPVVNTTPESAPASESAPVERERIVAWLREVNTGDTVRAKHGQKLAARIEAGEHAAV